MCHFERVNLSVKNFDLVFIYRDFANHKRISSIPMEQLDMIKEWLNESDVFYTEGPISLQWNNILTQIRLDIGGFLESGGWSFLKENDEGGDEDSEDGSDGNFDEAKEVEELGSEVEDSDDSGGSDFDDGSAASSSVKTDSEEEGDDWDTMERKTIERENE